MLRVTCLLSTLAFSLAVSGCSVGPDFERPNNPMLSVPVTNAGALKPEPVPADWWKLFNDPVLTRLEARAARENLDLQASAALLDASRAQLRITDAALLPRVGVGAGYAREGLSGNGQFALLGAPSTPYNYWQASFDASWEIDLWGHARRQGEEAVATVEASLQDREAMRVSTAAEVARQYLLLRGLQTRLSIVQQNLEIARHTLRLAESRQRNGVATRFDTATARSQIATTQALASQLEHERNRALSALALLLGQPPHALDKELAAAMPTPGMPQRLPVGIASELARRRPDILRAEARLHAATAAIGAAQADFYPRIKLLGSLGTQSFDLADLGSWASRQFTVGPTLYLPIFEGGRLKEQLALTQARQQAAAIAYRQAVLGAWHEADTAIDAYQAELRRHAELEDAYRQNREALSVAQRAYQEGSADYLSVLVTQRDLLASQSALADSATASALSLVALYRAIAGGWDPDLPSSHVEARP
jgi:NodT family efflux transporter outer membrane factor (OMF) lipoprotein